MEYTYATLMLDELDEEINETNITAVLEAAGADVSTSRVKAIVAALEGVDLDAIDPVTPDESADAEALDGSAGAPADEDADEWETLADDDDWMTDDAAAERDGADGEADDAPLELESGDAEDGTDADGDDAVAEDAMDAVAEDAMDAVAEDAVDDGSVATDTDAEAARGGAEER